MKLYRIQVHCGNMDCTKFGDYSCISFGVIAIDPLKTEDRQLYLRESAPFWGIDDSHGQTRRGTKIKLGSIQVHYRKMKFTKLGDYPHISLGDIAIDPLKTEDRQLHLRKSAPFRGIDGSHGQTPKGTKTKLGNIQVQWTNLVSTKFKSHSYISFGVIAIDPLKREDRQLSIYAN